MKRSGVGEKRARDTGDHNKAVEFFPGLKLSQHPPEQRKDLFLKKFSNIIKSKSLHPTEFEGYTIRERFAKMGWEQLLNFKCDKIYGRVVIEWMASLSKKGDELTGIVDGKSYTITPAVIRDILGVDTRIDLPYARFSETPIVENGRRWLEACNTVFGLNENGKEDGRYMIGKMTPLVKILWKIMFPAFHQLLGKRFFILPREIYLLHALFTGDYIYSFAHLMIDDIWNMYEDQNQHSIPHGSYISEILNRLGAVSKDECAEIVSPKYRVISRALFYLELVFSETTTEHIIDDREKEQRVTFPKKVTVRDAPPQFFPPSLKYIPPQMPVPDRQAEILAEEREKQTKERERLAEIYAQEREKRAEERQKQSEIRAEERQKQAEIWAEREKRAEEREKRAEERDKRAEEREKRAEEREKRAEIRSQVIEKRAEEKAKIRAEEIERRAGEREKLAEMQAQEREKQAEIRAHAIIWAIERQRYFYEKEQEQLRMAWNQFSGVDEFQFPQISHTSFHPQEGSQYYDPTQSNEIPKAFRSIYQDIYGPRH